MRQRLGCDDVIVGLDDGVVGLMEGDHIVWTSSVVAFDEGGDLDNVAEGKCRIDGDCWEGENTLGLAIDWVGALILYAYAVIGVAGVDGIDGERG